jgi:hypothetical protein
MKIEITPAKASELLFKLFEKKQWLISEKPVSHNMPDTEQEAVSFLLAIAKQNIDDWQGISQAARETVSLLLIDFLAKLMHPQSPFSNRCWQVTKGLSNEQKALEIIVAEIQQSHPHFVKPH